MRFQKPDTKAIRDEWSWSAIRRIVCYRPELWLGLPLVAMLSFVVIYLVGVVADFDVNHLRTGLIHAATTSFSYILGMITMAANAPKQKEEQEQDEDEEVQSPKQRIFAYVVFSAACLFLVINEVYEVAQNRVKILDTIATVMAIVACLTPALLAKLTNK